MKIGLSIGKIGLKIWLVTALLFWGFTATESACATNAVSAAPGFSLNQTTHTELAGITADVASNQSVRLVLFSFVIGVSAILIYVVVFKSAAKASIAKWFYRILRGTASRNRNCPNLRPPLFLHDKTKYMAHTGASQVSHAAPPLKKTDKLTETEDKK